MFLCEICSQRPHTLIWGAAGACIRGVFKLLCYFSSCARRRASKRKLNSAELNNLENMRTLAASRTGVTPRTPLPRTCEPEPVFVSIRRVNKNVYCCNTTEERNCLPCFPRTQVPYYEWVCWSSLRAVELQHACNISQHWIQYNSPYRSHLRSLAQLIGSNYWISCR